MRGLAATVAAGSLLIPAAAAAHAYQRADLWAMPRVRAWTSQPQTEAIVYLHIYASRPGHELRQMQVTPCRARYDGYGLTVSVTAAGCPHDGIRDDGRVRIRYVSLVRPTRLLVRITSSPVGVEP